MSFISPPLNTTRGATFSVSVGLSTPYIGVPITLSLAGNPGGGTLSGTLTQTTNASGFATFGGLSIDKVGDGYVIQAAVPGLTILSPAFNVTGTTGDVVTVAGSDWAPPLSTPTAAAYPFSIGRGVTFDTSGNMYAVDTAARLHGRWWTGYVGQNHGRIRHRARWLQQCLLCGCRSQTHP